MGKSRKNRGRRVDNTFDDSDDDDGFLTVGGVRIRIDTGGNVAGMTRQGAQAQQQRPPPPPSGRPQKKKHNHHQHYEPSSSDVVDSDVADYLDNIDEDSSDHQDAGNNGQQADAGVRASSRRQLEMLRRFSGVELGHEGAVEDIIGFDDEFVTSEEDSGDDDESSDSSFSSGDEVDDDDVGVYAVLEDAENDFDGVITAEELALLSPEMRFPVQPRPQPPPSTGGGGGEGGKKSRRKSGVKGAKGGKLLPGEKAKLRRAGIEARRAERASKRGLDLADVNKQLQDFVDSGNDVYIFPPLAKQDCQRICKIASLYGCKSGAQGSGKKRSVVVKLTQNTGHPQGEALLQVGRLLALQNVVELGNDAAAVKGKHPGRGNNKCGGSNKGRWSEFSFESHKSRKAKGTGGGDFSRPVGCAPKKHITFVSRGAINGDEDDEIEIVMGNGARGARNEEEEEDVVAVAVQATARAVEVEMQDINNAADHGKEENAAEAVDKQAYNIIGGAGLGFLPVFEDRGGAIGSSGEDGDDDDDGGFLAMRRSTLPEFSTRGAAAADGITNSGRLLNLGLALGLGSEVFGASGFASGATTADLSPLQPAMTKSAQRRLKKQRDKVKGCNKNAGAGGGGGGQPAAASNEAVVGEFTGWERHTTGVGSRLLAKWGFNGPGAGLGRDGAGIAEPLQVRQRAKKLGLGAER